MQSDEDIPFPERGQHYYARTVGLSRGVRSVAYDRDRQLLDVEFASREAYRYEGVEPEEFMAMMTSGSLGQYVNREIKPNHRCHKLPYPPRPPSGRHGRGA